MSDLPVSTEIKAKHTNPTLCYCRRKINNDSIVLKASTEFHYVRNYYTLLQDKRNSLQFELKGKNRLINLVSHVLREGGKFCSDDGRRILVPWKP